MKKSASLLAVVGCSLLLSACSSRSIGNAIDDQFLEPRVASAIEKSHADLNDTSSHIVVTAYNGAILLVGQTPRPELRQLAVQTASNSQGARTVYNYLQVAAPSSALARSNDATITSRIKALMLADNTVPSSKIKVVTENGIVYLLGIVTRAEGQRAANTARDVSGVQKIVTLFEYSDGSN